MSIVPATTVFDSLLFRDAFGTARMRAVFSDIALLTRYTEAEIEGFVARRICRRPPQA